MGSDAGAIHTIDPATAYDATLHGLVVVDLSTHVGLIVAGARGRSGLTRLLLGNTVKRVFRSVDVPAHCVPLRE